MKSEFYALVPKKDTPQMKAVSFPEVRRKTKIKGAPYKIGSWQYKAWAALCDYVAKYGKDSVVLKTSVKGEKIKRVAIMAKVSIQLDDGSKTVSATLPPSHKRLNQTYSFISSKRELEAALTDICSIYRNETNKRSACYPDADVVPVVKCLIEYDDGSYHDVIGINKVFKFFRAMEDDNGRIHIAGG